MTDTTMTPTTEFLQIIINFGLDLFDALLGFIVASLPSVLNGVLMLVSQLLGQQTA